MVISQIIIFSFLAFSFIGCVFAGVSLVIYKKKSNKIIAVIALILFLFYIINVLLSLSTAIQIFASPGQ